MARLDFSKKEDVEKVSKRIRYAFSKFSKGIGNEDECVQEILCRMLEGKGEHRTVDQFTIDYLRTITGRKGVASYSARQNLERADSVEPGDLERVLPMDIRGNRANGLDLDECARYSGDQIDRACLKLYFRWGLDEVEIANLFGVSPSRVSQRIKRIQGRISARIKSERSREQGKAGENLVKLLRPKEERNIWGVGKITFERMEIGQSLQMESYIQTSF